MNSNAYVPLFFFSHGEAKYALKVSELGQFLVKIFVSTARGVLSFLYLNCDSLVLCGAARNRFFVILLLSVLFAVVLGQLRLP